MEGDVSYTRPGRGIVRRYPPCTSADFGRYVALDREFRHLRSDQQFIRQVPESSQFRYLNVEDIEMDDPVAVTSTRGSGITLGTSGVATCVVICGRAKTAVEGERVFGMNHHSGANAPVDSIKDLMKEMHKQGAIDPKFWLVGGLVVPLQCRDGGSYEMERDLLEFSGRDIPDLGKFEIQGFALHCSAGEFKGNWNDESTANAVNVVLREDGIYYRKEPLF